MDERDGHVHGLKPAKTVCPEHAKQVTVFLAESVVEEEGYYVIPEADDHGLTPNIIRPVNGDFSEGMFTDSCCARNKKSEINCGF
uniref:Uncharacterized protein n=1 Tax=Panagrolaimus superbus TaxID=310955 RepID=A0A914YD36_9BILA